MLSLVLKVLPAADVETVAVVAWDAVYAYNRRAAVRGAYRYGVLERLEPVGFSLIEDCADASTIPFLGLTEGVTVEWTASRGSTYLLEREEYDVLEVMRCAIRGGRLNVLEWLEARDVIPRYPDNMWLDTMFRIACGHGHLAVAQWLYDKDMMTITLEYFKVMCDEGHVHMLPWILEQMDAKPNYPDIVRAAVYHDRLGVIQWLVTYKLWELPLNPRPTLVRCSLDGALRVMQWLVKEYQLDGIPDDVFWNACIYGHLAMARWLAGRFEIPLITTHQALPFALRGGHLPIANLLVELGCTKTDAGEIDLYSKRVKVWVNKTFIKS